MAIINVRVDGRLIHGQVAMLWTPSLQITRVMVIGDKIAADEFGKDALKLAKPAGAKLSILPPNRAIENILAGKYDSQRVLIVTREPEALVQMKEAGVPIDEINVGNVSNGDDKISIYKSVYLNEEEIACFKRLNELGVKLIHQMTPDSDQEDFMAALNEKTK
ncbi:MULTISPECIES: PTS system mannose/fructose/N-acetylgalactosamine-transporter subunit IIB [Enterococcus]|uniref:PTS sugar transporter subunit IIB n=1 Tax=Enterococcus alishanensis TaxID=1303817 RepID=A0ABS6TDF4_9ENTE|nr:PTS sugar transporter subunit IIB [Enterococcus alishanensis]MBV7390948.1 PTS sugar transporter subunit IIB [Enterococcus alishanensis]